MNVWSFLQWCLQDFWRWLGLFLLVVASFGMLGPLVSVRRTTKPSKPTSP